MSATFVQASGDLLYFLQASLDLGAYCIAFLPTQSSGVPTTLSLADTWQTYPGVYLFLGAAPASQATFAAKLATYLGDPAYPGLRFAWIANPDDQPARWQISRIALSQAGPGADGTTTALSLFPCRNLALYLGAGANVALNSTADGFLLTPQAPGSLYLTAESGAATLSDITSPLGLSFADQPGCLTFALTLQNSGPAPDFDRLDVGCRYFADDATLPGTGLLTSWRFPVFDAARSPAVLTLAASMDPLNQLDGQRTCFRFPTDGSTTLASYYSITAGYSLTLTPTAASEAHLLPRLVLAVRALSKPAGPTNPYYLAPAGLFAIGLAASAPAAAPGDSLALRIIGGTSGLEYLGLSQSTGNQLYFFPDQPAYAPTFGREGIAPSGLSDAATTAWVYVSTANNAGGAAYYSQPDQAPFFTPDEGDPFLPFLEFSTGDLPAQGAPDTAVPTMFPMVAFAGINPSDSTTALALEQQVLSPARRQLVSQLTTGATWPTVSATTPSGIIASWNNDGSMNLILAQTTGSSGTVQLALQSVKGPLQSALLANQLFLVISDLAALQQYASLAGSGLSIPAGSAGYWSFDLFSSQQWGAPTNPTLMIFKFANGALGDLAADPTTWTDATTFNTDPTATQKQLQAVIQQAETALANGNTNYAYFVDEVVNNPDWRGVLFLNASLPAAELPSELAVLSAGLNQPLLAQYLAITITPVGATGGQLAQNGVSAVYGLVAYDDPADLTYLGNPYAYKVLTLSVLFANTAMINFSSQVELMVCALFDDQVALQGGQHGNNLILNGFYQSQGGVGNFVFSTSTTALFMATSAVIDSVVVTSAQLVPVVASASSGEQPAELVWNFLLAGSLNFQTLSGLDLFSYGTGPYPNGSSQLCFTNLIIQMSYPSATPTDTSFTFNASGVSFDLTQSTPRPGSLFAGFPLQPTSFLQVTGDGITPSSLGYLGVQAPLGQSAVKAPWYGLLATLSLGSAGALAAAGDFSAVLLAAWSPSAVNPVVSIGLKLPGTGGSQSSFSLESVLKLKIGSVSLSVDDTGTYVLALNGIALSLLGLSFPPSGQTNAYLFGGKGDTGATGLGWYIGYLKSSS